MADRAREKRFKGGDAQEREEHISEAQPAVGGLPSAGANDQQRTHGVYGRTTPSTLAYTPNDCPLLPPSTGSSAPHWGEALNKYLLLFAEIAATN
jgi:hypothetical protein